jgi:hypothetical protein
VSKDLIPTTIPTDEAEEHAPATIREVLTETLEQVEKLTSSREKLPVCRPVSLTWIG